MYIQRHAEKAVTQLSRMFGAILVAGPRQVGKTTMLRNIIGTDIGYVTLDDPIYLTSAIGQSNTFLKDNPPPVFIDEVQKAPELFPQIKMMIDRDRGKGLFYLCGSQQFYMMKHVSESLAGRLGMLTLLGLSLRERLECEFNEPFLPDDGYYSRHRKTLPGVSYDDIWKMIHRGCMPELCANPDFDWQMFYGAYVRTYIERDVRELAQVGDEVKFIRFMSAIAGMTGQLLNLQSVANDVGISQPTADRWLSILTASNLVYLLRPYSNNRISRAVKTPKLYFLDTGLAAYLTRWNTPEVLKNGAMSGAFFESFVISEILKSYYNKGILDPPLYFYRDRDKREIDLLIEKDNTLYPIEIKKHADPSSRDIAHFSVLDKLGTIMRGPGGVVCLYDNLVALKGEDRVIPVCYL
ncbi:MAG: ATP-binding protein [Clostridiales bacterium]|nr:ATP-binding protein [Clostridiales bacterium]